MRWIANTFSPHARAKFRAAQDELELTGIQPSAAFNISMGSGIYSYPDVSRPWDRDEVENVQVVLDRTAVPDPYMEDTTWDVVVCAFAAFGGTRTISGLPLYEVADGTAVARKTEGPGGMLCVNAIASAGYQAMASVYQAQPDKVKALVAAIEAAVGPFFEDLPFCLVLDGSGSYHISAGGGGSGGARQIHRPPWITSLTGGSGGESGGYRPAPGGDGWRAQLLQQCKAQGRQVGTSAPSLQISYRSTPGYADGNPVRFIGTGSKVLTYSKGWGIWSAYPLYSGLGVYMGPFDSVRPTYIGSRTAFDVKEPLAVVAEPIYNPAAHPTRGGGVSGDYGFIGFDCPITLEHMQAICHAGLVGACTLRSYSDPFFVEGLDVEFDPSSASVYWGFPT